MRRDKVTKGSFIVLIIIVIFVSVLFFFFLQKDDNETKTTRSEITTTTTTENTTHKTGESYDPSKTKDKGVSSEATLDMQDDSTLEEDGKTDVVVAATEYDSTSINLIFADESIQEEIDPDIYYIRNLIYDNLYNKGYRDMKDIKITKGESDKEYMNLYYAVPDNPSDVTIKIYYSAASRIVELAE